MIASYLVCGMAPMPDGALKVYLHSRAEGYFIIVNNPEDILATKMMWARTMMGEMYVDASKIDASAIQREEIGI